MQSHLPTAFRAVDQKGPVVRAPFACLVLRWEGMRVPPTEMLLVKVVKVLDSKTASVKDIGCIILCDFYEFDIYTFIKLLRNHHLRLKRSNKHISIRYCTIIR